MIPVLIGLGVAGYMGHRLWKSKGMTPEQKRIYDEAMMSTLDPAKYRSLADTFDSQGFKPQAAMLRKRAALREAPAAQKAQWKGVFKKAMGSNDPAAIEKVAQAHETMGAIGAAADLRAHAQAVRQVQNA